MPEHQQTQQSTESKTTSQRQATPRIQTPVSNPFSIIQRARINPKSLTPADILQLQRTIGNRAVGRLISDIRSSSTAQKAPVQRQEIPEEEEPLQGKMIETIQRQEIPEEEEPLQGKFENKPEICPSCFVAPIVQRQEIPEEEEPLQGKMIGIIQRQEIPEEEEPLQTKRENNTGIPDNLKTGVESLSGIDMSDVRVHYSSEKPAEVGALAYTQGTDINVAPGQERHLPHEAWHVVQQAQGRVRPTIQLKGGVSVNDDEGLEHEADVMGTKAIQMRSSEKSACEFPIHHTTDMVSLWSLQTFSRSAPPSGTVVQCVGGLKFGMEVTGDTKNVDVQGGLEKLRIIQAEYKAAVKTDKQRASAVFEQQERAAGETRDTEEGRRAAIERQRVYTVALTTAEMTPEGLLTRLRDGLTNRDDVILYKDTEIAQIRRGAEAYVLDRGASQMAGSAIFKRRTLDGPSTKEYVDVYGHKLRRFAYRGITPPERAAYRAGHVLRPMSRGHEAQGLMGYNFDPATGEPGERKHDTDPASSKITDLEWLNQKAGTKLDTVPTDPQLLSFLQTRKGVGKLLSATSTDKPITSNHGKAFTGFGQIKIDLAKVPAAAILHHYKQRQFDSRYLLAAVGRRGSHSGALEWETTRANETVTRNREIVLREIPAAAVAELVDTPERIAYETEFKRLYEPAFTRGYTDAIRDAELNLGDAVPPAPPTFPWNESHFTADQAKKDFNEIVAMQNGRDAAVSRIDFGRAYLYAYRQAWIHSYENAAWDSPYVTSLPIDQYSSLQIAVPEVSYPNPIPPGVDQARGITQGGLDGDAAGAAKGATYTE